MTIQTEYALLVAIVSVLFAIYSGIANLSRNRKHDDQKEAASGAKIEESLKRIDAGVTDIKHDMRTIKDEIKETRERVIKVEESAKQAHKRIDSIENKKRGGDSE